jgi:phospholipase/carboxylesterase
MKRFIVIVFLGISCFEGLSQKINTSFVYLVQEPAKKSSKPPVLIMLHGYGSNEQDLIDLSPLLDTRFIVFSLRAPLQVSTEGFAWYKMEFLKDQKFKYRYEETKLSREKILDFISKACAAYGADSNQVFVMGFSQGAILSYDLAFAAPKKIRGVLALSGRLLEETKSAKTDWMALDQVKFFIAHGDVDRVIKFSDSEKTAEFLKTKKVSDVTFKKYNMAHAIEKNELADIKQWLSVALNAKKETEAKQ